MRFASSILLPLLYTFAAAQPLNAQTVSDSVATDSMYRGALQELVVTARRSASPLLETPEAIEQLRAATIRRQQARSSPEALWANAGVFVQKTNHGGGSPFLRGLTGNQTLLLLDGIRLNNATFRYGPNQYFNTIDVFSLDRIEVLRGNGSVQYGSDALGGTIQAFSHDAVLAATPTWGGTVLLRGATQGMEQSAHGRLNFSSSRVAATGGLSYRHFGDLVGGDSTGRQTPSGYPEFDVDVKARFVLSPSTQLVAAHQQVHQWQVPVFHKIQLENFAENAFDPQRRQLSYARLEQALQRQGPWRSFSLTASVQETEEGRRSQKNGSSVLRYENDKVRSLGMIAQINSVFSQYWTANSGIDVYHDRVRSSRTDTDQSTGIANPKRGLYPDGSTMTSFSVFTLHEAAVQDWRFTAGARWNGFDISARDEAIGAVRLHPSALVGNLSVLRKAGQNARVFAAFNSAFRAPNIDDLGTLGIVDFRFETPNYALQPEHSFQYQLGYKYSGKTVQGELYLYRSELRDLITRIRQDTQTRQGYPLYQKENAERAYIQGVESSWRYAFRQRWTLQGNLSYTYGQNLTQREPMRRIPPLFGRLALDYQPGPWSFGLEAQAAGTQRRLAKGDTEDNRIPKGGTPGWALLNLYAGVTWKHVSVRLSALNLWNTDYRTHGSGVNGYGRSVFVTVSTQW